jgi:hypothetical protein
MISPLIRTMRSDDLDFAAQCTAGEGWSTETRREFEGFLAYDAQGWGRVSSIRPSSICRSAAALPSLWMPYCGPHLSTNPLASEGYAVHSDSQKG